MENRPRSLAACLSCIALLVASGIAAQEALPEEGAQTEIERGLAMQAEARQIQEEAEAALAAEREACDTKFFVNDCRHDAYDRYLEKLDRSRKLGIEGRDAEAKQRRRDLETARVQQAIDAAALEEKDAERAKTVAEERAARKRSYEERQGKRAAEAEQRAQKAAARKENAEKKQEETALKRARLAEKKADKARNRNAPTDYSETEETQR
ncbi:MAG: hypothetical protein FWG81_00465 [Betaproteobacteria bacterium]|nr:hypothetical protein [Betaproteobacteria bacterium]